MPVPRSATRDTEGIAGALGGDGDGAALGGVLGGVLDEVADDLGDVGGVGERGREVGHLDADRVVNEGAGGLGEGLTRRWRSSGVGCEGHVDLLRVELGHLDGLGNEAVEAVDLGVDLGEELLTEAGVLRSPLGCEQARRWRS